MERHALFQQNSFPKIKGPIILEIIIMLAH